MSRRETHDMSIILRLAESRKQEAQQGRHAERLGVQWLLCNAARPKAAQQRAGLWSHHASVTSQQLCTALCDVSVVGCCNVWVTDEGGGRAAGGAAALE